MRPPSAVVVANSASASLLDLIGNTPLIKLQHLVENPRVEIYGKAEWANPGGSVKDRPALRMIREGERCGALTRDRTIIDATSGNTGIAYAMIGAALGYRVKLGLPRNAGEERKRILRAYGAELVLTDPLSGSDGAIRVVREIVEADPGRYFYPDQYNNPANWMAHYETTGPEIFEQTGGRITHFIAGLGTSGTFMGVGRRLRELNPGTRLISMQPDSPFHGLEGLKHMETAIVPGIYDDQLADEQVKVSTEEAFETVRRLARHAGWLVGISAAANVAAAMQVANRIDEGVIVTILCDDGSKYLSEKLWEAA
ncbi:MAG: cysteine synthase family protein [Acidobacteria bacterium]|nr:cysteine synthase family protein [Acidobacteriota bacterium]